MAPKLSETILLQVVERDTGKNFQKCDRGCHRDIFLNQTRYLRIS